MGRASSVPPPARSRRTHHEEGTALSVVLVVLLLFAAFSAAFVGLMNRQQTQAGQRYRATTALLVAEAGVHRALAILEADAPDGSGPGRVWRPTEYSEAIRTDALEGRYALSLADDAAGSIIVTSTGEAAGLTRRLRARVYLASPALLAGLYGSSVMRFERPSATLVVLPYGAGAALRPWVHLAAGRGVGFASANVSINEPSVATKPRPGPADVPEGVHRDAPGAPTPLSILLARGADLTYGPKGDRIDVLQLRVLGARFEGTVSRVDVLPALPELDRAYFQAQAAANTSNAGLNAAAGKYTGDEDLARKTDSFYSQDQFERIQNYLRSGRGSDLRGVVYVDGAVEVAPRQRLVIAEGALIAERTVRVGQEASLEVTHSVATRTLPGIVVLDGALQLTRRARLRVHGLVFAGRIIDIWDQATVDVVGAVAGNDRALSFRAFAATVLIRYDPAVLATPGLRLPDDAPIVAWVAAWEELP